MKPHWAHSAGAPVFRAGLVYVAAAYVLCAAVTRAAMGLAIEPLWVADPDMIMEGAAMVADLDGDGSAEVVTAAYESIIVVDGAGTERWRFDGRGRYSTCPALLERPGQPPLIYAGDNTGLLTCLDGHGDVVWQRDIAPVFCSSPALADLNGDGTLELVQGSLKGTLSVFNALTGAPLWTRDLGADCGSPAVGDIHGDGRPEIVMATGAGKLFALDAEGTPLWEFALGGTAPDWAICSAVICGDASGRAGIAAGSSDSADLRMRSTHAQTRLITSMHARAVSILDSAAYASMYWYAPPRSALCVSPMQVSRTAPPSSATISLCHFASLSPPKRWSAEWMSSWVHVERFSTPSMMDSPFAPRW